MKTQFAVLASATRTSDTNSSGIDTTGRRSIVFFWNITAASGTGGLTIGFRYWDYYAAAWRMFTAASIITAVTATGYRTLWLTDVGSTTLTLGAGVIVPLPRLIRAEIKHADASNYDYDMTAAFFT